MARSDGKPSTIRLIADPPGSREDEVTLDAAASPGHFIQYDADGKYVKNATADVVREVVILLEDVLQGKSIDDAYASGAKARALWLRPGDVVQARLGTGQDISVDEELTLANDGTVKTVAGSEEVLAVALEAVDNDPGSAEVFIKIRIISGT